MRELLVDDRIDRDGGLSRLAVTDDKLALAAADRDHRVDSLDSGLERLVHRMARDHAGCLALDRKKMLCVDRSLSVERNTDRVDDAAEELLADRNRSHAAGTLDSVTLVDQLVVAEEDDADVVLLEVQRHADHVVRELDHLRGEDIAEPIHTRDTVADLKDGTDIVHVDFAREPGQLLAKDRSDLIWADFNHNLYSLKFISISSCSPHPSRQATRAGDRAGDVPKRRSSGPGTLRGSRR
jgi:hypothetical protein